jgi:hypothetical protein
MTEITINGKVYGVKFGNFAISECENRFGFNPLSMSEEHRLNIDLLHKLVFCGILNFYRKQTECPITWDEFYDAYDDGNIALIEVMKCIEAFGKSQVVSNYVEFGKSLEAENSKKKKK